MPPTLTGADHPRQGPGQYPSLLEALDPATGAHRLAELAHAPDWCVRAQVAERPDAPFEVVGMLAHDESPEVVAAVVARPDLSPPILQEVLAHCHAGVRAGAAEHPALSTTFQAVAAMDPAVQVRIAVANRVDLVHETAALLVDDEARVVRATLLANPSTPRWIWRRGIADPAPGNRLLLLERLDLTPGAALALAEDEQIQWLAGAEELIKTALSRALGGMRPARRRRRALRLLMGANRAPRAAMIAALGMV